MEEKGANTATAADLSTTSTMIDTSVGGGRGESVTETPKRTPMLKLGRTKLGASRTYMMENNTEDSGLHESVDPRADS